MKRVWRENGLSIVLASIFVAAMVGQTVAGHSTYNEEQREHGQQAVKLGEYVRSGHFWEATAENWESEFLQMFLYVILTAFLYQKGSAESRKLDAENPQDRDPREHRRRTRAPWPVRKGNELVLKLYENSLSIAFLTLFVISIVLHAVGGFPEYRLEQIEHGAPPPAGVMEYVTSSQFWFESMQNWQSEFLSLLAMVVLTIFLREKGSAESKPVATPHGESGEDAPKLVPVPVPVPATSAPTLTGQDAHDGRPVAQPA